MRRHSYERYPRLPDEILWEERKLLSVVNLTRQDGIDFRRTVSTIGIVANTTVFHSSMRTRPRRFPLAVSRAQLFFTP